MADAKDEYIRQMRIDKALRELRAVSTQLDILGIKHIFQIEGLAKLERTHNGNNKQ